MSISPEGNHVAFIGIRNGTRQLYVRALDSPEATPLAGTEDAYCTPTFSPDGQALLFYDVGPSELKKVALQGGSPQTVAKAGGILGATWGSADSIIYSDINAPGLRRISSAGGAPAQITRADAVRGETAHRWPTFLPGGKAILFTIANGGNPDNSQVVAQRLDTGERRVLVQGGTFPQYVPAGYLAYVRNGQLMAAPFDLERLQVSSQAVAVSEEVQESGSGGSQFGLSRQGSLVYVPPSRAHRRLLWMSRDGAEQYLGARAQYYGGVRLSPDGRRAALEVDNQVWLYDLSRETLTRFTLEGDFNFDPIWSPDGNRIAFQSHKDGAWNIFWQWTDSSGGREQLTNSQYRPAPASWSPDGQLIAFVEPNPLTQVDIWILRLSDRKAWPFLQSRFNERAPAFSPDGNWLAYSCDESGRYEVYVQAFPGPGGKYQISTDGGKEPVWNPKGRELFFLNGNKIMAVKVAMSPRFSAGEARVLSEGQYGAAVRDGESPSFGVSPDGQRLLVHKQAGEATQINVVLNWFEELKQRVPSGT